MLNGRKRYIANGSVAKLFFIDGRTDPNAPITQGTTLFLVPTDTPGFRVGKVYDKIGWRFYQNAELIFEDARVPHANVVGEVNRGIQAEKRRYVRIRRSGTLLQRAGRVPGGGRHGDAPRENALAGR